MAKLKAKTLHKGTAFEQPSTRQITLSELRDNSDLSYKLKVLIYDLANIKSDLASMTRLERTIDELYISEPYFTSSEAEVVKSTLITFFNESEDTKDGIIENTEEDNESAKPTATQKPSPPAEGEAQVRTQTVEEAIKRRLATFYDKRTASGDFRPCGPHDMVPVYLKVFGIEKGDLEDERFLGRLRRSGISASKVTRGGSKDGGKDEKKEKGRRKK